MELIDLSDNKNYFSIVFIRFSKQPKEGNNRNVHQRINKISLFTQ